MERLSVEAFLKTVLRSGLLSTAEYDTIRQSAPVDACGDARSLSEYLVRAGRLSRFQASKLLEGVTLGLVLGPYHVLAPIGRGGMGAVYLARDARTQGLAAVKVLPPKRAKAQERLLQRFRREMEISQRMVHPHLTRTVEAGVHLGINYIAMEYIPGQNLYRLVHDTGPLKVQRAARMFAEAALGMEYAHFQGLIHRDLKPSNIMVMPDDHVKVLDLGLALILGESDAERTIVGGQGYVVGTLDYLAPEQAEDPLKVDARSDIYSLGCALYFSLTGSAPFAGGNALQKMLRHRCDPPKPVCEVNPTVPATFAVLLTRMIAKKPELRFQSAAELRAALLPWTGDTPSIGMATAEKPPAQPGAANGPSPRPAPVSVPQPAAKGANPAPAWVTAPASPAPAAAGAIRSQPAAAPVVPAAPRPGASAPAPATSAPAARLADQVPASVAAAMGTEPPPAKPPVAVLVSAAAASPSVPLAIPIAASPLPPVPLAAPPAAAVVPPAPPSAAPKSAGTAPAAPMGGVAHVPAAVEPRRPAMSAALAPRAAIAPPADAAPRPPIAPAPPPPAPLSPKVDSAPPPATAVPDAPASPATSPPMAVVVDGPDAGSGVHTEVIVDDVPFWLDYVVPVASGGVFLVVAWLLAVLILWQS